MTDFSRAPHQGHLASPVPGAPNAALLIDFDNVTMGIRSDLTKELKKLLNSDIIKGKVAVQRAYADWRRYPQYIVPLSEASVDLIFAPAYGSSKKNATDIRLAIDALEIVFTRPEIGTYILLSGDSDFSSLVLKLKEYGKYVIGVGLKESTSDLLVQNCDEYYSYSALTGLTRAGEERAATAEDPWVLVERAVRQMDADGDVMRSDRLKQVMLELYPAFDEKGLGFSKFNRFLTEAAGKGALQIKKLENGQYEVGVPGSMPTGATEKPAKEGRGRRDSSGRGQERQARREPEPKREPRAEKAEPASASAAERPEHKPEPKSAPVEDHTVRAVPRPRRGVAESELERAYDLLRRAVDDLTPSGEAARDSDVKRRMLELEPNWDESEIGFSKFSRFLRQAHDAEIVNLRKTSEGYYEVVLPGGSSSSGGGRRRGSRTSKREDRGDSRRRGRGEEKPRKEERQEEAPVEEAPAAEAAAATRDERRGRREADTGSDRTPDAQAPAAEVKDEASEPAASEPAEAAKPGEASSVEEPGRDEAGPASKTPAPGPRVPLTGRRGSRGRHHEGPPPLLPGQTVSTRAELEPRAGGHDGGSPAQQAPAASDGGQPERGGSATGPEGAFAPARYNLPVEAGAVIRYLSNSYKGVGKKTAEQLIDEFGAAGVFTALATQPDRVREVLGAGRRTDQLIEAWEADFERRQARAVTPTS
ncbi:MAG: NYN domain-containing protein [Gemmatimonadota bacterium]